MIGRDVRPESKVQLDPKGRLINWPEIDKGRTRPELNGEIVDINQYRDTFGSMPLLQQISNFTAYIDMMMAKCADLEAIIPASMLPTWMRLKVEYYKA